MGEMLSLGHAEVSLLPGCREHPTLQQATAQQQSTMLVRFMVGT